MHRHMNEGESEREIDAHSLGLRRLNPRMQKEQETIWYDVFIIWRTQRQTVTKYMQHRANTSR